MIETATDRHLWAKSYERDLSDVLSLQRKVAMAIAREIKIAVTPEEKVRLEQAYLTNPEAYQLYLQGRLFWNKRTEEDLKKGIEYFEQTIEKEPAYALAYAGLADSYSLFTSYSSIPGKEVFPKAKEAALRALEIDNTIAEAHTSMGFIKTFFDRDWDGAEIEFTQAIELNPGYATAHH